MPGDRLEILQEGFVAMAEDAAFRSDAKGINFDVDPISGDAVVKAIAEAAKTPRAIMDQFSQMVAEK
jgi:hypothetical protein